MTTVFWLPVMISTYVSSKDITSGLSAYPQKYSGVRIAHLNCNIVLPHKEEVMYDAQTDVMALTEAWLDDTVSDHDIFKTGVRRPQAGACLFL